MLRIAQTFDSWQSDNFVSASRKVAVFLAIVSLSGCGAGGFSLEKAEIDRSIITSNVPEDPSLSASTDPDLAADQVTIRNAASSADLQGLAGNAVSWANPDTGSRGSITQLSESRVGGQLCRTFTATRERFDGVALFSGRICALGAGIWQLDGFSTA